MHKGPKQRVDLAQGLQPRGKFRLFKASPACKWTGECFCCVELWDDWPGAKPCKGCLDQHTAMLFSSFSTVSKYQFDLYPNISPTEHNTSMQGKYFIH